MNQCDRSNASPKNVEENIAGYMDTYIHMDIHMDRKMYPPNSPSPPRSPPRFLDGWGQVQNQNKLCLDSTKTWRRYKTLHTPANNVINTFTTPCLGSKYKKSGQCCQ